MATFFFFFFFFFFFVSGLKLDGKSIENGLEGQKFLVVCLFWGGCHHPNQYLFAVQFFNSYVYRGRINKGYLGGLDKVFKIRDRHHRIRRQILRKDEGIILILAQS